MSMMSRKEVSSDLTQNNFRYFQ